MKILFLLFFTTGLALGQNEIKNFENKTYSLKAKGVNSFVVDIKIDDLEKKLNEQKNFGIIKDLVFRVYWTARPERTAIEIIGMPEGFKEVKEQLKSLLLPMLEYLIPLTYEDKYKNYKFQKENGELVAKDQSGIANITSFIFKFDPSDKLSAIIGQKPLGNFLVKPNYSKESFSDGKWVLKDLVIEDGDPARTIVIKKNLKYGQADGFGVLTSITIDTEIKASGESKSGITSEEFRLINYKINSEEAVKYFSPAN